jgi:outer membrane scaffolding protein for murein synthesis (MipA/OmpV family)
MRAAAVWLLCGLALAGTAAARELPLWEVGAGASGLVLPDYRGSDQSRGYVYPVPYVIYRGDRFRIDRDRIREFLFHTDRLELELNVNANVPVNSYRNNARHGMPNLYAVVEGGPAL